MPADPTGSLAQYLAALPEGRVRTHSVVAAAIAERAATAPREQELLFIAGHRHPDYEDGADRFWHAVEQLALPEPAGADELPLAWIGYDVVDRFTGRREAQGFLLTDRRLLVKDQVDGVFGTATPRQYPLFVGSAGVAGSASEIAASAASSYDWEFARSLIDADTASGLGVLLSELLVAAMETLQRAGAELAPEPPTSTGLLGRVRELGLGNAVKLPGDPKHAKHFAKLAKKLPLDPGERILIACTDSTLIGAYGFLLTDRGARSKDLGEDPAFTPTEQFVPDQIRRAPDSAHRILLGAGETHEIPTRFTEQQVDALIVLLREWGEGRLDADAA